MIVTEWLFVEVFVTAFVVLFGGAMLFRHHQLSRRIGEHSIKLPRPDREKLIELQEREADAALHHALHAEPERPPYQRDPLEEEFDRLREAVGRRAMMELSRRGARPKPRRP